MTMIIKRIMLIGLVSMTLGGYAADVSNVKARQRYPWNGKVDIDCTLSGTAGTTYALTVTARDKIGGTNLTVKAVSVDGGASSGNPVSVTPGTYRLVWDAEADLPVGFRGEKISISVSVGESAKKYMIVDLQSGAISYQADVPDGGWNVDEYKGTKMAFVRIEPGTFTQRTVEGVPGRQVTITKPYYIGILPITHRQLRTLCGGTYGVGTYGTEYKFTFEDTAADFTITLSDYHNGYPNYYNPNPLIAFRGGRATNGEDVSKIWPFSGMTVETGSPLDRLRLLTGLGDFYLPTEAQLSFARTSIVWNGYCIALDAWTPWLGTANVVDPQGPEIIVPATGPGQVNGDWMYFHNTCVSDTLRSRSRDVTAGGRFCLQVAE